MWSANEEVANPIAWGRAESQFAKFRRDDGVECHAIVNKQQPAICVLIVCGPMQSGEPARSHLRLICCSGRQIVVSPCLSPRLIFLQEKRMPVSFFLSSDLIYIILINIIQPNNGNNNYL